MRATFDRCVNRTSYFVPSVCFHFRFEETGRSSGFTCIDHFREASERFAVRVFPKELIDWRGKNSWPSIQT